MYLRNLSATQVVTTKEAATSVVMMLNFAFIADGNEGLLFVDVLNPCDQKSKLNDRKKNYVPVKGLINSMAVQEEIKRPIGSISSEFFFWALLFFPIIGLARLLYNRASLRRVDPQFVLGSDRPFWLGLLLLGALAVFHIWTLTW